MMYDEFESKTGLTVDYAYYESVVECVYRNLPCEVYGGCENTQFCEWVRKNGGLKIIDQFYPLCKNMEDARTWLGEKDAIIDRTAATLDRKNEEIAKLKKRLAVYEKMVPTDILESRVCELGREALLDILAERESA